MFQVPCHGRKRLRNSSVVTESVYSDVIARAQVSSDPNDAVRRNATFDDHYIPHDGDRESLWLESGTKGVMGGLGFYPTVVERPRNKLEAISTARCAFARCHFDEQSCALGLKRLRAYRKEWDEDRGVWKDRPRHDDASHGADAFLTFACSG